MKNFRSGSNIPTFILCLLTLLALQAFVAAKVHAEDIPVSWTGSDPVLMSSTKTPYIGQSFCSGYYRSSKIDGEFSPYKICMNYGDNVNFGVYHLGSGSAFLPAVNFGYDSKMYKINGICGEFDSCLYLPNQDLLVTKQYVVNNYVRSLVIYKNFTSRLTKTVNTGSFSTEYVFDSSNPDYVFKDSVSGYAWPIGGIGVSRNGKWLVMEFRERGLGLFNTETFEMKRISTTWFYYGHGADPHTEITVSEDGKHVAYMGMNVSAYAIDVDEGCGDLANDSNMQAVLPIANPCKEKYIDTISLLGKYYTGYQPRFSDDAGELSFYVSAGAGIGDDLEVMLRAQGHQINSLKYLALGDSYTSGEGEIDDNYYMEGTNEAYDTCHLSIRSYPFLVADSLGYDPSTVRSVACSGATTEDVTADIDQYYGQGGRLNRPGFNTTDMALAKSQAKFRFLPGIAPQGYFIGKYVPKVMTIGIGGNDAGLMSVLTTCVIPGTCDAAGTDKGREQTAAEIKNIYGKLVKTYQEMHNSSPKSKIYAISYPKIVDPTGECSLADSTLIDEVERQFMDESIKYLNQVIKAAAKTAGIGYINVEDSLGGHVICGPLEPSGINALRLGSEQFIFGSESFHPSPLGHSYIANSIVGKAGDLAKYNYCEDGSVLCPAETLPPEPSSYWTSGEYNDYPLKKYVNFLSNRQNATNNRQKNIRLDKLSFSPNSKAKMEITSEPRLLGEYKTSSDGSLEADIEYPEDLEDGTHTVHIYGTSYSGEDIEIYQVVSYTKAIIPAESEKSEPLPQVTAAAQQENIVDDYVALQIKDVAEAPSSSQQSIVDDKEAENTEELLVLTTDPVEVAVLDENKDVSSEVKGAYTINDKSGSEPESGLGSEKTFQPILIIVVAALLVAAAASVYKIAFARRR